MNKTIKSIRCTNGTMKRISRGETEWTGVSGATIIGPTAAALPVINQIARTDKAGRQTKTLHSGEQMNLVGVRKLLIKAGKKRSKKNTCGAVGEDFRGLSSCC